MLDPLIVMLAPNGASKQKIDHKNLPISAEELADESLNWQNYGATILHLHVRDNNTQHTLEKKYYQEAIMAIENKIGNNLLIQATSEAGGIYSAKEQMQHILALKPKATSLAIREYIKQKNDHESFSKFCHLLKQNKIWPQYIIYDENDLAILCDLYKLGLLPEKNLFILLALGRKNEPKWNNPKNQVKFLNKFINSAIYEHCSWAACGFGPSEYLTLTQVICLGGHVRVGFENNIMLANSRIATSNTELIKQITYIAKTLNREIAGINYVAELRGKYCS